MRELLCRCCGAGVANAASNHLLAPAGNAPAGGSTRRTRHGCRRRCKLLLHLRPWCRMLPVIRLLPCWHAAGPSCLSKVNRRWLRRCCRCYCSAFWRVRCSAFRRQAGEQVCIQRCPARKAAPAKCLQVHSSRSGMLDGTVQGASCLARLSAGQARLTCSCSSAGQAVLHAPPLQEPVACRQLLRAPRAERPGPASNQDFPLLPTELGMPASQPVQVLRP